MDKLNPGIVRTLIMDSLNPGIVRTVAWLRGHGFNTCDSGDGVTHDHPCDRDYPYVSMHCKPSNLGPETLRLWSLMKDAGITVYSLGEATADETVVMVRKPCIQASYDPADGSAIIDLMGVRDAMLPEKLP